MEIKNILSSVQQTAAVHPKYLKEFTDIYKEVDALQNSI